MRRKIENELFRWKEKKKRKPLLLQGARQVGKTYILKQFGEREFRHCHYFDLEEIRSDAVPIFEESVLNPKEIIDQLSFISGKTIDVKNDILILDEIQSIPRALTALKYFNQNMEELAIAAAGSNLGVIHGTEPFPVGKVEIATLYPLNFDEFLAGIKEDTASEFVSRFTGGKTIDTYHRRLFGLLKTYFITGGMPEAILEYMENKDQPIEAFKAVRSIQKQLILHYERDFSKYSGNTNSRHIERIFKSIPRQLSSTLNGKAKKFLFKDVISKGYRGYEAVADPIDWLVKAGLAFKVNVNEHPSRPILAGAQENSFKFFLFDVGLLGALTNLGPETIMRYDYGTYKGYFAENFVLQELHSYGFNQIVTWAGRTSEIEFVLEYAGDVVPIEVKAGINTKAKSLSAYINKYHPVCAVKITGNKYGYDRIRKTVNYPLYMISRFPDFLRQ